MIRDDKAVTSRLPVITMCVQDKVVFLHYSFREVSRVCYSFTLVIIIQSCDIGIVDFCQESIKVSLRLGKPSGEITTRYHLAGIISASYLRHTLAALYTVSVFAAYTLLWRRFFVNSDS